MANYIYNGIELPELPEWDKETYPYAMIIQANTDTPIIDLSLCTGKAYLSKHTNSVGANVDCLYAKTNLVENAYELHSQTWNGPFDGDYVANEPWHGVYGYVPIWSNYDIYRDDGSLYLAASDPVPVGGAEWQKHDAYKPNTEWKDHTFYKVIDNKWVKHDAVVPAETLPEQILPDGYTLVDYIESSGTQYIDTELKPTQNTGFEVDFISHNTISTDNFGSLFGARLNSNNRELLLSSYGGFGGKGLFRFGFTSYDALIESGVRLSATLRNGVYSNSLGAELDVASSEFTSPVNLVLFACNHNGSIMEYGKVRLYSLKLYDGDTLVRDYVPCETDGGECGLWDKVESKFYGNAGTGTLVAGYLSE